MNLTDIASKVLNTVTGGVVDKAMGMIDKLIPDRNLAAQVKAQLDTLRLTQEHEAEMAEVQLLLGQIQVNTEEAKSSSLFVAGWRPFIGWTCGAGVAYAYVLHPMALFVAFMFDVDVSRMPALDIGTLLSLVMAMLGVAGLRSLDKKNGVAP